MANIVFIATSLDGYIADKNGEIDWLQALPNPENNDMGYGTHMEKVDAIIMGRNTVEKVLSFGIDWPYNVPVYMLTNTLLKVPKGYEGKIFLCNGKPEDIVAELNNQGYNNLYIDGGVTIQSFLKADLIDEMVITTIPVLLGGGVSLFGELAAPLNFTCIDSKIYLDAIVQNHFIRQR